jgi:hypothetical protein
MNDLLEIWSLPWHTLQRRLAMGVGTENGVQVCRLAPAAGTEAGSWLMRALNAVPAQPNAPRRLE